ncbi:MAG TPA: PQQ-binding-like beta-propeller repeat protein [Verrucomicrobiota bacterium]|nr:PQQ-binding-like beta-propeller repeat protein [Verrucomicrobiota bacterium]
MWQAGHPTDYRDDFGFDEGPCATPAIAGGRVFTFGAEGRLSCWSLADGTAVWGVDTQKECGSPKGFFGRACSPLVESNLAIVIVGGRGGAGIVAFDAATGRGPVDGKWLPDTALGAYAAWRTSSRRTPIASAKMNYSDSAEKPHFPENGTLICNHLRTVSAPKWGFFSRVYSMGRPPFFAFPPLPFPRFVPCDFAFYHSPEASSPNGLGCPERQSARPVTLRC